MLGYIVLILLIFLGYHIKRQSKFLREFRKEVINTKMIRNKELNPDELFHNTSQGFYGDIRIVLPLYECNHCKMISYLGDSYKLCSKCKSVHYCSVDCQKQGWKIHKMVCDPLSQETGDILHEIIRKICTRQLTDRFFGNPYRWFIFTYNHLETTITTKDARNFLRKPTEFNWDRSSYPYGKLAHLNMGTW
jgi:hypothetical protein